MPLVMELSPRQIVIFDKIGKNWRPMALKSSDGTEKLASRRCRGGWRAGCGKTAYGNSHGIERENAAISIETLQAKIAASTACHAAIKVNIAPRAFENEWLLDALAKTDCPMSCPHGRQWCCGIP